jgi:hypothetical protein
MYLDVTMGAPIAPEKLSCRTVTSEAELCRPWVPLTGRPNMRLGVRPSNHGWLSAVRQKCGVDKDVSAAQKLSPTVTVSLNRFMHPIDQPFLDEARSRARDHISANRVEFLRLARQAGDGADKPLD